MIPNFFLYNFLRPINIINISPYVWPVLTWRFLPLCLRSQSHCLLLSTAITLLTQSCWFDIFACRVVLPPGTEQEILLATAVTTHLTNTIAAQLNQTTTACQHFHIKSKTTPFQEYYNSYILGLSIICEYVRPQSCKLWKMLTFIFGLLLKSVTLNPHFTYIYFNTKWML